MSFAQPYQSFDESSSRRNSPPQPTVEDSKTETDEHEGGKAAASQAQENLLTRPMPNKLDLSFLLQHRDSEIGNQKPAFQSQTQPSTTTIELPQRQEPDPRPMLPPISCAIQRTPSAFPYRPSQFPTAVYSQRSPVSQNSVPTTVPAFEPNTSYNRPDIAASWPHPPLGTVVQDNYSLWQNGNSALPPISNAWIVEQRPAQNVSYPHNEWTSRHEWHNDISPPSPLPTQNPFLPLTHQRLQTPYMRPLDNHPTIRYPNHSTHNPIFGDRPDTYSGEHSQPPPRIRLGSALTPTNRTYTPRSRVYPIRSRSGRIAWVEDFSSDSDSDNNAQGSSLHRGTHTDRRSPERSRSTRKEKGREKERVSKAPNYMDQIAQAVDYRSRVEKRPQEPPDTGPESSATSSFASRSSVFTGKSTRSSRSSVTSNDGDVKIDTDAASEGEVTIEKHVSDKQTESTDVTPITEKFTLKLQKGYAIMKIGQVEVAMDGGVEIVVVSNKADQVKEEAGSSGPRVETGDQDQEDEEEKDKSQSSSFAASWTEEEMNLKEIWIASEDGMIVKSAVSERQDPTLSMRCDQEGWIDAKIETEGGGGDERKITRINVQPERASLESNTEERKSQIFREEDESSQWNSDISADDDSILGTLDEGKFGGPRIRAKQNHEEHKDWTNDEDTERKQPKIAQMDRIAEARDPYLFRYVEHDNAKRNYLLETIHSSRLGSETVQSEFSERTKPGKPVLVGQEAIVDLNYPFEGESDMIIIQKQHANEDNNEAIESSSEIQGDSQTTQIHQVSTSSPTSNRQKAELTKEALTEIYEMDAIDTRVQESVSFDADPTHETASQQHFRVQMIEQTMSDLLFKHPERSDRSYRTESSPELQETGPETESLPYTGGDHQGSETSDSLGILRDKEINCPDSICSSHYICSESFHKSDPCIHCAGKCEPTQTNLPAVDLDTHSGSEYLYPLSKNKTSSKSPQKSNAILEFPDQLEPSGTKDAPNPKLGFLAKIRRLLQPGPQKGFQRIEWTCGCGEPLYADFWNKSHDELHRMAAILQAPASQPPRSTNSRLPIPTSFATPFHLRSGSSSSGSNSSFTRSGSLSSGSSPCTTCPSSLSSRNNSVRISTFLELCVNTGEHLIELGEIDLSRVRCDGDLFAAVRKRYHEIRGFRVRFWLLKPKAISYVRFSVEQRRRVGILQKPLAVPPKSEVDLKRWIYDPCPLDGDPPIAEHLFLHYLQCPQKSGTLFWFLRLPRKLKTSILSSGIAPIAFGWGIHIEEGPNFKILFWINFAALMASGGFAAVWTVYKKDFQGAFGFACWAVAVLNSLLLAFIWKWKQE